MSESNKEKEKQRDTSPAPSAYSTTSGLEWDPSADVGTSGSVLDVRGRKQSSSDSTIISTILPPPHERGSNVYGVDSSTPLEFQPLERGERLCGERGYAQIHAERGRGGYVQQRQYGRRDNMGYAQIHGDGHGHGGNTGPGYADIHRRNTNALGYTQIHRDRIVEAGYSQIHRDNEYGHMEVGYGQIHGGNLGYAQIHRDNIINFDEFQRRAAAGQRSQSMFDLGIRDSMTDYPARPESAFSRHVQSDNSGDYSRKPEQSGRSGLSEWLEVGMTKSEKRLRDEKEKESSGDSVLFLHVKGDKSATVNSSRGDARRPGCVDIGVQANFSSSHTSASSSVYHSTPNDFSKPKSKRMDAAVQVQEGRRSRKDRSPVKPFAVASRKSPHHHHHAHHCRIQEPGVSSFFESTRSTDGEKHTSGSSELSPPCFLIEKLIKPAKSPVPKEDIVSALEMHRDYHVKKVRHELRQLEKLNHLLTKSLAVKHRYHSTPPTNTSESESYNKENTKPRRSPTRKKSPKKVPQTKDRDTAHAQRHENVVSSAEAESTSVTSEPEQGHGDTETHSTERLPLPKPKKSDKKKDSSAGRAQVKKPVSLTIMYDTPEEEGDIEFLKLREMFEKRCPSVVLRLREREAVLQRIKEEREVRAAQKREWIRLYGDNYRALREMNEYLPQKGPRLMSSKQMREITRRNYEKLPEVREKALLKKMEEEKATNRVMSQVFAQELRRGVLQGEINHEHARSILRR